ncbi:MAG: NAD-dependent epimerase/dehydratase family protein [Gemmatimonadaceae bacterium]
MSNSPLPTEDLAAVTAAIAPWMTPWRGKRILLTGANGFFGHWLVETFHHANQALGLGATLVAVTGPDADIARTSPHFPGMKDVQLVQADIRRLRHELGAHGGVISAGIDAVINTAIHVDTTTYAAQPLETLETAIVGSWEVMELARQCGAQRVLLTSSGAVYGTQPPDLERIPEEHSSALDPTNTALAYGEGKRACEMIGSCYHREHGTEVVMVRPFAFVGPRLPIDRHFAIGNFIRDALAGGPVVVSGDGRPVRSYLYAADLAVALWALLAKGTAGRAYNVGSERAQSLGEVASVVARAADPSMKVEVRGAPAAGPAPRYIPDTSRLRSELGVQQSVELGDAIARTLAWHRGSSR